MSRIPRASGAADDRYAIAKKLSEITWNNTQPRESLTAVYDVIDNLLVLEAKWYGKHLWQQRLGARLVQGLTVVLLFIGVLLPILSAALIANDPAPDWARAYTAGQIGYAALLFAALLLLLDQVFQLSSGWARFLSTELSLYTQLLQTRFLLLSLQAAWGEGQPDSEKALQALDLLKDQVVGVTKIVQSETATWSTELQKGLDALRSRIDTATVSAEAQVKAIQTGAASANDPRNGTISVEVTGQSAGREMLVVLRGTSLASELKATLTSPSNVVFERLAAGKYVVSVESKEKQTGRRQRVVQLEQGQDEQVSVEFDG